MNNKTIIIVIIAVLVIGGVAAYFLFSNKSGNENQLPASITGGNQQETASESSSLKDLLASGRSQKCTFSDTTDNVSSQGTTYIGDGKIRVDFSSVDNNQSINGHMIADAQTFYTWMDGSSEGFKMAITADQETDQSSQSLDIDKKIDYKCGAWSPDSSLFNLPSGVQFKDFSSLIPQIPQEQTQTQPGAGSGSQDIQAAQCSACDSAPEDARAACRQALGCQ